MVNNALIMVMAGGQLATAKQSRKRVWLDQWSVKVGCFAR